MTNSSGRRCGAWFSFVPLGGWDVDSVVAVVVIVVVVGSVFDEEAPVATVAALSASVNPSE